MPKAHQARLKRAPGRDLQLIQAAENRLSARLASFFAATARNVSREISARLARETPLVKASGRVRRDAFLYLDPVGDRFAQCGTCKEFLADGSCYVFGSKVAAGGSCGLYIPGKADPDWVVDGRFVSPWDAGYVEHQVRCENCRFFDGSSSCGLYVDLNERLPETFDLDPIVHQQGCCNAQMPKELTARAELEEMLARIIKGSPSPLLSRSSTHPGVTDLHVKPENAIPIYGIPVADPVTSANVQHVFTEMMREGKAATRRVTLPLDSLIATQRVVDRQRVAKHQAALSAGKGLEPDQAPPLIILWDGDNFIQGGHHGLQAAYNLDVQDVDVDLLVAPT